MFAIFALLVFLIPPVFAVQNCPINVDPSPVFWRDANVAISSQYENNPWSYGGLVRFEARLMRWVNLASYDDDGNLEYGAGSGWQWIKTQTWWPDHDVGFPWPVTFYDRLNLDGLAWGWNPPVSRWDMVEWYVGYKIEWWWEQFPWPLSDWVMVGETSEATTAHNEVKGKIADVWWAGQLSGYGGVYNEWGIEGLWPDEDEAAIYGYVEGDSGAIFGITNAYLGSPFTHDIQLYCHTWDGYEPYIYVFVSNDYQNWYSAGEGMIYNTEPTYIDVGAPNMQFHFIAIVAEVPYGHYGAVLWIDCVTVFPTWY